MVMDLMYESSSLEPRARHHFHEFMLDTHKQLHAQKQLGAEDPLPAVAGALARFGQHCYSHHMGAHGCERDRACAFLHAELGAENKEAEDPSWAWVAGAHVSSQAPALAALLLGDVEGEGAEGGVALSPAAVASVLDGLVTAMARPSSSGSFIWCVIV